MKIAIYSPYLDTAGGGEKYILTIAELLSSREQVDILLDTNLLSIGAESIKTKIENFHGLDLSRITFIKAPLGPKESAIKRLFFLRKYDWLFYLTDGSIFLSTSKNSIIHFQVPFKNTDAKGIWGKVKLKSWKKAIYNSFFTKKIVEESWPIKGEVIHPPVEVNYPKILKKKKQILSVGRFFSYDKAKKQKYLIDAFKEMSSKGLLEGWSLCLVGGASEGDLKYVKDLRKQASSKKIPILTNVSLSELKKLYSESSIYWHATGFGETDPVKFEHFGISTVEAMAAGCVPIVINLGGQKEIVEQGISGFLWDDKRALERFTQEVIQDNKLRDSLALAAIKRSQKFSKDIFIKKIMNLVYS